MQCSEFLSPFIETDDSGWTPSYCRNIRACFRKRRASRQIGLVGSYGYAVPYLVSPYCPNNVCWQRNYIIVIFRFVRLHQLLFPETDADHALIELRETQLPSLRFRLRRGFVSPTRSSPLASNLLACQKRAH